MGVITLTKSMEKLQHACAISFTPDSGIAITHIDYTSPSPSLDFCSYFSSASPQELGTILAGEVKKYQLQNMDCVWVLYPQDYTLLSIDALPVTAAELPNALRWRVRDLIDYPITDASIDYFCIPQPDNVAEQFVYAAVTRTNYLLQYARLIKACGLHLKVIDIPEIALRNVLTLLPESQQSVALLYFHQHGVKLLFVQQGYIYLVRQINPYIDMSSGTKVLDGQAFQENLLNALLLEIQRSCDYYENQLGRPSVAKLLVVPSYHPLVPKLSDQLPFEVTGIDLTGLITQRFVLNPELQAQCLTAIGGALGLGVNNETAN